MRALPTSFLFFLIAVAVVVLQLIPFTGIFLMFMLAPLWSVVLINFGMLGTGFEAATGRVSRLWLILPLAWYGLYALAAARDEATLKLLRAQISAHNDQVRVPFDSARHSLVSSDDGLNSRGIHVEWFVQNYALPVAYTHTPATKSSSAQYLATRLVGRTDCDKVRDTPGASGAGIYTGGFHNDQPDRLGERFVKEFCILRQPESPVLPQVRVSIIERTERVNGLPTVQTATTIDAPDDTTYRLRGGRAAPLRWFPMLAVGCGLNSAAARWDCDWGFLRANFTLLVEKGVRYRGDPLVFAEALGLQRVAPSERRGAPSKLVATLTERITADALATDLADLNKVTAEPHAKIDSIPFRVLSNDTQVLASRGEQIMQALEGAVGASQADSYGTRDNGRNIGRLIAKLPSPQFEAFGPRILAL